MRINSSVTAYNNYQQLSANTSNLSKATEALQSGSRNDRVAATDDVDRARTLQLGRTQTVQTTASPSTVVRISPEALALSRNADIVTAASATGFTAAPAASNGQAVGTVQSANTTDSNPAQRAAIRGLSQPSDGTPDRDTTTTAQASTTRVNQASNAAQVADRASDRSTNTHAVLQTQHQILNQAGAALLAQANSTPQSVLAVLR